MDSGTNNCLQAKIAVMAKLRTKMVKIAKKLEITERARRFKMAEKEMLIFL